GGASLCSGSSLTATCGTGANSERTATTPTTPSTPTTAAAAVMPRSSAIDQPVWRGSLDGGVRARRQRGQIPRGAVIGRLQRGQLIIAIGPALPCLDSYPMLGRPAPID